MSDSVSFTPVSPELVDYCWIEAGSMLKRACDFSTGRYDIISLRKEIDSGSQVLWLLYRGDNELIAAITTAVSAYPLKKLLNISFCGSNDEGIWLKHRDIIISTLETWAHEAGCDGIEVVGRAGWAKSLKPLGFKKTYTTMEKDI